jgi:hypothetical protein
LLPAAPIIAVRRAEASSQHLQAVSAGHGDQEDVRPGCVEDHQASPGEIREGGDAGIGAEAWEGAYGDRVVPAVEEIGGATKDAVMGLSAQRGAHDRRLGRPCSQIMDEVGAMTSMRTSCSGPLALDIRSGSGNALTS